MFGKLFRYTIIAAGLLSLFIAALFLGDYVATNNGAQDVIYRFGFVGVVLISFISGFNVLLPLPPATFVPILTAAGFALPFIIIGFVIGTVLADFAGYVLGYAGRDIVNNRYPKLVAFLLRIYEKHRRWFPSLIFCLAAFAPLPNETFVIPLALLGIPFYTFLTPLFLGTITYHLTTVYGVQNIFAYFF